MSDNTHLEGGFIQVNKRVYKGTVRTRDTKQVQWTCNHNHSRPEYNARWTADESQVWEASALNCGRLAREEWPNPKGFNGRIGDPNISIELRDDARRAMVKGTSYIGRIALSDDGTRRLTVGLEEEPGWYGVINMDLAPTKGITAPSIHGDDLEEWATAAWLLKGGVWGLVFQDSRVSMSSDSVISRALDEMLPGRKKLRTSTPPEGTLSVPRMEREGSSTEGKASSPATSPKKPPISVQPHIQVGRDNGKRVYEVINHKGEVSSTHVHRGKAVESLTRLKKRSRA